MGWQCSSFARIGAETHHTPRTPHESTLLVPNSVLCFQHKLKTKAKFQPPEAALKPTRATWDIVNRVQLHDATQNRKTAPGCRRRAYRRPNSGGHPKRWPASQDWLPPKNRRGRAKKLMDGSTIRGPIVFNKLGFVCSRHGTHIHPQRPQNQKARAGRTQPGLESCGSTHTAGWRYLSNSSKLPMSSTRTLRSSSSAADGPASFSAAQPGNAPKRLPISRRRMARAPSWRPFCSASLNTGPKVS